MLGLAEIIVIILAIAFSVLGIILFVKIWIMTNDIKDIKKYLRELLSEIERKRPVKCV